MGGGAGVSITGCSVVEGQDANLDATRGTTSTADVNLYLQAEGKSETMVVPYGKIPLALVYKSFE